MFNKHIFWFGDGQVVLGDLSVPGRRTKLDHSRVGADGVV